MEETLEHLNEMEKQWKNLEMSDLSKKSYTLNHQFTLGANNGGTYTQNNTEEDGANASVSSDNSNAVLQPGSHIKPNVNMDNVESLLRRLWGITALEVRELISYDDRNYFVQEDRNIKNPIIATHWPHGYVLKILNALDSKKTDFVDAQNQLLIYLAKQGINCPKPIPHVTGKYFSVERINGQTHVVRLLEYIPGQMFHQVEKTNYLIYQSGEYIAKVDKALKNFNHEAYETHQTLWQLQSIPKLRDFIYVLKDHSRKAIVEDIIDSFEKEVLSKLDTFEKQIIHGDYNEQNIVVDIPKGQEEYKVVGVIDFGDTNKSPIIFEVGIAMTYMMLQAKSLEAGGIFLAGYTMVRPLTVEEKQYLKYCVAARLVQSLVMGAYTHTLDPANEYVLVTQEDGWKLVQQFWGENFNKMDELWQVAADKYLTQSVK